MIKPVSGIMLSTEGACTFGIVDELSILLKYAGSIALIRCSSGGWVAKKPKKPALTDSPKQK